MKILKEPPDFKDWKITITCKNNTHWCELLPACGAELEIEEKDLSLSKCRESSNYYAIVKCPLCGTIIVVNSVEKLPLPIWRRMIERKRESRYDSCREPRDTR